MVHSLQNKVIKQGGTSMEAVYYAARANLRRLLGRYPQWTQQQYAKAVGMEVALGQEMEAAPLRGRTRGGSRVAQSFASS